MNQGNIDGFRELRLWLTQIIFPISSILVGIYFLNEEHREKFMSKFFKD